VALKYTEFMKWYLKDNALLMAMVFLIETYRWGLLSIPISAPTIVAVFMLVGTIQYFVQ